MENAPSASVPIDDFFGDGMPSDRPKESANPRLLIIDGGNLTHRGFHSTPPDMASPDGRPTNAVHGFFSLMLRAIDEISPEVVAVAWDGGKSEHRMLLMPNYKGDRSPMDDDLRSQFPLVENLVGCLGLPHYRTPGVEADDIVATLAVMNTAQGRETVILSSDRDFLQLVDESVTLVRPIPGGNGFEWNRPAEVLEKYGVEPGIYVDYLGLKGDPGDCIPGVPGIGPKKAAALLDEFGSLEAVLEAAAAGKVKGKMGEALVEHAQQALDSRTMADLIRDMELVFDWDSGLWGDFDLSGTAGDGFRELGLSRVLGRLERHSTRLAAPPELEGDFDYMPSLFGDDPAF